jgi:heme A synthase
LSAAIVEELESVWVCCGWRLCNLTVALHVSGVTITHLQEHKTTAPTASGNLYTVLLSAAIVEELELIWVCCGWRTPPTTHSNRFQLIAADSINAVTNTRCCRYSCMRSWRWVIVTPKTCRAVNRLNELCVLCILLCLYTRILLRYTDP